MNNDQRRQLVTRDGLLKLLSDDEIGKVSTAETRDKLSDGDEYVDLEKLSLGVQRAPGTVMDMGGVLPRKSVHHETWGKVLRLLQNAPKTHDERPL